MSIDGVNNNSQIRSKYKIKDAAQQNMQASASNGLAEALSGAGKKASEKNETLSSNERKAWIKDYQATHNCSKKEAKAAFDKEFGKLEKMSRKDAKQWVEDYMKQNECSKKDAKEAFKKEFGYNVPLSTGAVVLRSILVGMNPLSNLGHTIDVLSGHKLGLHKFASGKSNNDAKFEKRLQEQDSEITKYNNNVKQYQDKDGNTVLRVDYGNNNPDSFDEEEVISPEGQTLSVTKRSYTSDGEQIYEKHIFNANGDIEIVERTVYDKNNNQIEPTTYHSSDEVPINTGIVHLAPTPSDGWGDPQLQKFVQEKGGRYIGQD